ncbi:hypothetical protein [Acuticoccus sp. I52.16.1]|uniref:hypothetical protein n=1 Tax=Acuticoccus sp. I52.16.1 TaxID=2928472 RepID=UPI001FD53691|nr:hypothetical protein [Acuticoccus sp. I52.16.1]UOM34188.1 hypothetical protein MRB58_20545 [Acuticoccus sp. I52.16.1]
MNTFNVAATADFDWIQAETMPFDPPPSDGQFERSAIGAGEAGERDQHGTGRLSEAYTPAVRGIFG